MTSFVEPHISDYDPPDAVVAEDPTSFPIALVIDAAAGTLVSANAAGRRMWGLPEGEEGIPLPLDRAMPTLQRLAQAALAPGGEILVFWTPRGLLQLHCRVQATASEPNRFLVRAAADGAKGTPRAHDGNPRPEPTPGVSGRMDDAAPTPSATPALARLAHEVRTPLGAAIAYAEILKNEHLGPIGNARYREYARNIYDSARLALSVLDGMLPPLLAPERSDEAGLPELAFRELDLAGVMDACVAVGRPLAERAGLDLIASHSPGMPRVIADEVSLKQMLLNLITNAIKFARPGDRITLAADYGGDGCLRLEVADTGPGMSAEPPAAPAADGSASGRGGIGLPLTRALAKANGADLIVDSAPGRGTRATIAFRKDRVVPV